MDFSALDALVGKFRKGSPNIAAAFDELKRLLGLLEAGSSAVRVDALAAVAALRQELDARDAELVVRLGELEARVAALEPTLAVTPVGPGGLLVAVASASDGDTLVITGESNVGNLNITKRLTLKGADATGKVVGRLVFRAAGIVVEGLRLDGKYAGQLGNEPSWTVGAPDCVIRGCDMTNQNTAIGINQVAGGDRLLVESCRIHHVGKFGAAASFEQPMLHKDGRYSGNRDHGIYLAASGAIVRDCEIWACSDRGVQFRGAQGARAERVWVHDCGMGFMFGDLNASDNHAVDCRAENNTVPGRALVESYQPGPGNSYQGVARNDDARRAVNAPGVTVTLT